MTPTPEQPLRRNRSAARRWLDRHGRRPRPQLEVRHGRTCASPAHQPNAGRGTLIRLALVGELDMLTADDLTAEIAHARRRADMIELDLAGVTAIDSYGLRVLITAQLIGPSAISIVRASPEVSQLLAMTGLSASFAFDERGDPR